MSFTRVTLKSYRDVPDLPDPTEPEDPVPLSAHTVTFIITQGRAEILIAQAAGSRRICMHAEGSVDVLPEWLRNITMEALMLSEELSPQPR